MANEDFYKNENYVSNSSSTSSDVESVSDSDTEETSTTKTVECLPSGIPPTYFGNIDVQHSSNVHFGNTAVYNGDVTVQQFVATSQSPPEVIRNIENLKSITGAQPTPIFSLNDNVKSPKSSKFATPPLAQQLSIIVANSEGESNKRQKRLLLAVGGSCIVIIVVLIAVLAVVGLGAGFTPTPAPPTWGGADWENFKNVSLLNGTEGVAPYYSRIKWLAQPVQGYEPLQHPVPYVIISHSATNECTNHSQCVFQVRNMQTYHIEGRGWLDIAYNFVVGGDGGAYEGRGWDAVGAHTYGYNNRGIGICFVGTFTILLPPAEQVRAAKLLIENGIRLKKISPAYRLLAHRQVSATESPGKAFFEEIKKWSHWVPDPAAPLP